jgi:hypothetical protein
VPLASPDKRFQVVSGPVSFYCEAGTDGTLNLWRAWGYDHQDRFRSRAADSARWSRPRLSTCAGMFSSVTTASQRAALVGINLELRGRNDSARGHPPGAPGPHRQHAMKPFHSSPRRERGVGIVTAIFLLVVLAGLARPWSRCTPASRPRATSTWPARAPTRPRAPASNGACSARAPAMPARRSPCRPVPRCPAYRHRQLHAQTGRRSPLARISAVACNYPDSQGGCNCDGAVGTCTASSNPESVSRKVEVQL